MIKMTIHNGEEVQQRDLPCDFLSLRMSLYQMNLMLAPNEVSVRDVEASFESADPLGQKIIGLIRPGDLLSDVDVAIHQIKAAPQAIQEAMRQKLMDGAFETIEDIQIGRDKLLEEMCGFRQLYYFPLACSTEDEDGELFENDSVDLTLYSEDIQDAIERDQARDIDTMAMFFWTHDQKVNDAIRAKLLTCDWGIEEIGGKLYGRVEVTAAEPFTPVEDSAMKDWISGQNSDGLGEGFEQRPIETVDGSIYVHFWNSGNDYRIVTDDEIERELYGKNNWLDWSLANWGSKWNSMPTEDPDEEYEPGTLRFLTANNPPHPVLQKLSEMYPDITMEHQWADDDIGMGCGQRTYQAGKIIDEYYPDYGRRAIEFACEVTGQTPADRGLVLNDKGTDYINIELMEGGMYL